MLVATERNHNNVLGRAERATTPTCGWLASAEHPQESDGSKGRQHQAQSFAHEPYEDS